MMRVHLPAAKAREVLAATHDLLLRQAGKKLARVADDLLRIAHHSAGHHGLRFRRAQI
jgi:hypothetical protein